MIIKKKNISKKYVDIQNVHFASKEKFIKSVNSLFKPIRYSKTSVEYNYCLKNGFNLYL